MNFTFNNKQYHAWIAIPGLEYTKKGNIIPDFTLAERDLGMRIQISPQRLQCAPAENFRWTSVYTENGSHGRCDAVTRARLGWVT